MQEILGQPRAIGTLRAALDSGRLHHAWIFAGPRGVGKFTTAIAFARILLEPGGETGGNGPPSRTARLIEAGTHPDLHVIQKELALYSDNPMLRQRKLLSIPLDLIRERMIGGTTGDGKHHEPVVFRTPFFSQSKVFIIDEAELLADITQNALLKTLEEPPERTYLILITTRPQRLLATIHSRSHHVRFVPLDAEAMAEWFRRCALGLDPAQRAWIQRFCCGSPGIAQLAADYGFYRWNNTLEPMIGTLNDGEFPVEMGMALADLVEEFATAWVKRHENASKDAANKQGAGYLLAILAAHARGRLVDHLDASQDADQWLAVIDLIRAAERQLDANVNLKLVLENLVVQWAATPQAALRHGEQR